MFQVLPKQTEKLHLQPKTRHFEVTTTNHGFKGLKDDGWLKTSLCGRAAVVLYFRKRFGKEPTTSWGDGFMAEAWDKSGNRVMLEQMHYNYIRGGVYQSHLPKVH